MLFTKMETTQKQWGAIGILSVIVLAMGGNIYLTPDQLDHAYICTTNQNIVIANRLSSTSKTAYWTENGSEKSKICTNGVWKNLKQYAKENNIEINVLINQIPAISGISPGTQYLCDPIKCERIR